MLGENWKHKEHTSKYLSAGHYSFDDTVENSAWKKKSIALLRRIYNRAKAKAIAKMICFHFCAAYLHYSDFPVKQILFCFVYMS